MWSREGSLNYGFEDNGPAAGEGRGGGETWQETGQRNGWSEEGGRCVFRGQTLEIP